MCVCVCVRVRVRVRACVCVHAGTRCRTVVDDRYHTYCDDHYRINWCTMTTITILFLLCR